MRCVVPYCNNDSGRVSKTKGVVFHIFPSIPSMRKAWIQILDKPPDWTPKEGNAICSDHFLPEDLYTTTGGQRRVRVGAVPIIAKSPISNDYSDPENLMVCRICLAIDRKLYSMSSHKLGQAYEHVIGLSLAAEDRLPQKVCIECAMRLSNYFKFKNKGLRANKLMLEILKKEEFLTVNNIQSVDRERNHLIDLNIKAYDPNYADFDVEYKEDKPVLPPVIVKDEIENEIYITENDEDPHRDAVAYSDDDFSSEDSLPLENQRKQRKKIVKKEVVKVRKKQEKKMPVEPKIDRRRKPFLNDHLNETLFTITDLSFEEQIAEIEKRRESSNYKNAVFKCDECFKGFLDEAAYTTHVTRHTDQYGEHECEICKTHFKHPHALRKHITAHHTQRFSCNQCSYVTTHRQTARLHERWHKGTKYHCPHCQDEFVKFTTYMGHIRIKHPSDFICELCGYSFVSAKGIELHKKLKHRLEDAKVPEDGPYCEPCKVRFVSQEAYRRHLNESGRHTVEKNEPSKGRGRRPRQVVIKERNRESEEKRVYPSQMRRAEGPIPCEQCGMQLEDSRAYHGHFRRMHPDKNRTNYPSMKSPCMCEVCGRMFQSYALLKDHTWVHTGERPFKCDSCDKSFRMKQRLVAHRRVHSQLKRTYVCSVCGKHFSTHSNRQRHMIIHTGLKPFKCEMCGKGFKHASEKRAHVTYVHLKKPWPKRTRAKRRLDGRTSQIQPPQSLATSGSEMDMQPIWPPCDPKLNEINTMMDDKPMYYNLKHVI